MAEKIDKISTRSKDAEKCERLPKPKKKCLRSHSWSNLERKSECDKSSPLRAIPVDIENDRQQNIQDLRPKPAERERPSSPLRARNIPLKNMENNYQPLSAKIRIKKVNEEKNSAKMMTTENEQLKQKIQELQGKIKSYQEKERHYEELAEKIVMLEKENIYMQEQIAGYNKLKENFDNQENERYYEELAENIVTLEEENIYMRQQIAGYDKLKEDFELMEQVKTEMLSEIEDLQNEKREMKSLLRQQDDLWEKIRRRIDISKEPREETKIRKGKHISKHEDKKPGKMERRMPTLVQHHSSQKSSVRKLLSIMPKHDSLVSRYEESEDETTANQIDDLEELDVEASATSNMPTNSMSTTCTKKTVSSENNRYNISCNTVNFHSNSSVSHDSGCSGAEDSLSSQSTSKD